MDCYNVGLRCFVLMILTSESYLLPDWPAPSNIGALVTTRMGGVSCPPYQAFNLALHVDDQPASVLENRRQLQRLLGTGSRFQWLNQVHGTRVVKALLGGGEQAADGLYSREPNVVCAILTADCLPVFFCTADGQQVALAHAGWRGLAAGILEQTLDTFTVPSQDLLVWLGPAIGPRHFKVGDEVRDIYLSVSGSFAEAFLSQSKGYWLADLYRLATLRLNMRGVKAIYGGDHCTFADTERFYSYRRDGLTGRMASLIWIKK